MVVDIDEEYAFSDYKNVPEIIDREYLLESNILQMAEHQLTKKNKDLIILVVGEPGSGKSALTFLLEKFIRKGEVDFSKWAYTHDQFTSIFRNNKQEVINYDEGRDSFYRRKAMSKKNTEAMNMMFQYRFKNHICFINFQNLSDIEPDLLYQRSHAIIRVTHQGWFHFHNKKNIQEIDVDSKSKKVSYPDPNFRGAFPDPAELYSEEWALYEEDNEEKLEEQGEKKEEHSSDPTVWLSTGDFAERLSVSSKAVRTWCDEGKIDHRKLPNGDRRIPEDQVEKMLEG